MDVVSGNLLEIEEGIICHQVNCQGVMGAGVAKAIASRYPQVLSAYRELCDTPTPWQLLGQIQAVRSAREPQLRSNGYKLPQILRP